MQVVEVQDVPGDRPARTIWQAYGQPRDRMIPGRERDGHCVQQRPIRQRKVLGGRLEAVRPPGQCQGKRGNDLAPPADAAAA
jgi:hypothetical protein